MAGNTIEKSKTIALREQPMTALHLITQGRVQAEYPGGTYQLGVGDVIGICEICSEVHFLGYTALENTTVMTFPLSNMEALENVLQKRPDIAKLFILSMFRQFNALMSQSSVSEMNSVSLYQSLTEDYEKCNALCSRYQIPPRTLPELDSIHAYLGEEAPDVWLNSYYIALQHIYAGTNSGIMLQEPGLSLGILRKGSLDFRKTYSVLDEQYRYRSQIMECYFNESENDLFDILTKLYYRLGQSNNDSDGLYDNISRMILLLEECPDLNAEHVAARTQSFRDRIKQLSAPKKEFSPEDDSIPNIMEELENSLDVILAFASLDHETENSFRQHVNAYKATEEKNSTEDACNRLRKQLTEEFYQLYTSVFERSVPAPNIPIAVRMFLYFGYVDEELAGTDNCVTLYRLAHSIINPGQSGVYTFYDWLLAIYNGEKSPSRSELDEDFSDYVHKQKRQSNLSSAAVTDLENNPMERVRYELQNMFPSVNKITYGRVTTFCPIFTAENVLKDLNASYVTPVQIEKALDTIRHVDYSAFYRESLDFDNMQIMGKENIHLEFLPDIILMPNVGIKGAMWQEIEGKKRNSPSRMIFSIFHMEDLSTSMIRLTGEFRWELCKRIQGGRWNDVTDASLTSEYFDYVQFFRKNTELSKDAKEKLLISLQRAKNSFKEMFVRDYVVWVLFESNGSARLNKVARRILFTYCPFPASLDSSLEQNPMYAELLHRQKITSAQRVHHLNAIAQKLRNSNTLVPESLEREIKFASREPV